MRILILYKSFLGATKQYAEWLAERVDGLARSWGNFSEDEVDKFDVVVVSSGTYAGWMPLGSYLSKHWELLKDKRVVVLAVGLAPEDDEWSERSFKKIPENIRKNVKYFKLPGKTMMGTDPGNDIKKANLDPVVKYIRNGK